MRQRKRRTWLAWRRVREAEVIPNGLSWKSTWDGVFVYVRAEEKIRRFHVWRWTRRGLAPELLRTPLASPWLSRTAGRAILRSDAERAAMRRIGAITVALTMNTDAFTQAARQAEAALAEFGRKVQLGFSGVLTDAGKERLFR